jgi:dipeptidyl aminopeptidase/acylaminoacyl peptidase
VTEKKLGQPRDCEFTARIDGSTERYVERLPPDFDPEQPCDLLIGLHGHGSDRWQYAKETRGECKGVRDVAARHGLIFISPDYRAKTSWMGPTAEADLLQLIGLLREKYRIARVFVAGGSMGGTAALIFAALHPDLVAGVLAENATANLIEYPNFLDFIAVAYGGTKEEKPEEYQKRSPELTPERFTMPVALTVGGRDAAVPPDSVRRLFRQWQKLGRKDVLLLDRPDGGHETNYDDTVTAIEFVIHAAER